MSMYSGKTARKYLPRSLFDHMWSLYHLKTSKTAPQVVNKFLRCRVHQPIFDHIGLVVTVTFDF